MPERIIKHAVAKPFATPHRRFSVGAAIAPDDITGPVSFDDWKQRGFIAESTEQQDGGAGTGADSDAAE